MAKTYTIEKTRRGKKTFIVGTVAELVQHFSYTLETGHSWNAKINTNPKTVTSLISALNKSVAEMQGSCYDPDYYKLAE